MECPLCRCAKFYLKDPDDQFETYEFSWRDGEALFECDEELPPFDDNSVAYCDRCAWHGKLGEMKGS